VSIPLVFLGLAPRHAGPLLVTLVYRPCFFFRRQIDLDPAVSEDVRSARASHRREAIQRWRAPPPLPSPEAAGRFHWAVFDQQVVVPPLDQPRLVGVMTWQQLIHFPCLPHDGGHLEPLTPSTNLFISLRHGSPRWCAHLIDC
jgi:hypothetical protein